MMMNERNTHLNPCSRMIYDHCCVQVRTHLQSHLLQLLRWWWKEPSWARGQGGR